MVARTDGHRGDGHIVRPKGIALIRVPVVLFCRQTCLDAVRVLCECKCRVDAGIRAYDGGDGDGHVLQLLYIVAQVIYVSPFHGSPTKIGCEVLQQQNQTWEVAKVRTPFYFGQVSCI